MRGFTDAWLKDYESKRRGVSVLGECFSIRFTLAKPTLLLNDLLRMHFRERSAYQRKLSAEIARLTRHIEHGAPFERAIVTVERFSSQEPDADGLTGGLKPMIDCLLVRSDIHPVGLGFIVDDSPQHMTLRASHVKSAMRGQATTVTIERDA